MDIAESVIIRVCSGDSDAFDDLFRQYQKTVYRTAYLLTGERETADDVLQEVFISVWRYCGTYNPQKGSFQTWLNRITVNCCNKKLKKMNRNKPLSIEKIQDEGAQLNAGNPSNPEEINITREEYERLLRAMAELSAELRTVVVLRFFNDLSYGEIAEAAAIPLGTVKSRLNAALKQMNHLFYIEGTTDYGL